MIPRRCHETTAPLLLIVLIAALTGCGRDPAQPLRRAASRTAAVPRLIHSPPIAKLSAEQLRSLSMDCEKYVPDELARGPYDAAYCEDAIAAWADSPIQMVAI